MARSVWKGPFVEESLMKKVDKYKENVLKYIVANKSQIQLKLKQN